MIAVDSSSLIQFFAGSNGDDVAAVDLALSQSLACLPPVVLTELFSDPKLADEVAELLLAVPLLDLEPGFWERAGRLRSSVLAKGRRARLADTLIAQCCLDHGVPLITRDRDFGVFQKAGLALLP